MCSRFFKSITLDEGHILVSTPFPPCVGISTFQPIWSYTLVMLNQKLSRTVTDDTVGLPFKVVGAYTY